WLGGLLGLRVRADALILDHCRRALLYFACQAGKEVTQMDATKVVPLQIDPKLIRGQHAGAAWHRSPADGRIVVKDRADADHAIRPVENFACATGANLAPIDACELRMILRKEAFRRGHDGNGTAKSFSEFDCLLFRACRPQLATDQQDWFLLALQELRGSRNSGTQGLGVARLLAEDGADWAGRRTRS